MTDVRAILEEQALLHRKRSLLLKRLSVGFAAFFVVLGAIQLLRGKAVEDVIRMFFPLLFVGGIAAAYTSRHLQALEDAIADPDPALDPLFAEVLTAPQPDVASLGRQAFVRRFAERVPELDDAGWALVARSVGAASTSEADRMISLLNKGGMYGAVAALEAFAEATKEERLATASRAALGEIRHRTARELVLEAARAAESRQEEAQARLSGTL